MNCADQKTAKIYTFPVRARATSAVTALERLEMEARQPLSAASGSGWYHEEAIAQVVKQTRSR
ncbi:MAG: DUF2735 domain-containing protein [Hyphomicrobiaceae bacterium]